MVGTLSGALITYDLRINKSISELYYNKGTPVLGMILLKKNKNTNKSLLIWSGSEDYEIGIWKMDENYKIRRIFDILLRVNSIDYEDEKTQEPLLLDIPLIKEEYNAKNEYIINTKNKIKTNFKNLNKYTYLYNTISNRNLIHSKINDELYFSCKKNLNSLYNIYESPIAVQCVLSPLCGDNVYENASYLLSGGNDRTIRYWDISRDTNGEIREKNSYIVNTPTNMTNCVYSQIKIDKHSTIIQSNEIFNQPETKQKIPGFSEYQNYNGINYYSSEKSIKSGYSTRNLDVSHKSAVTDLLTFNLDDDNTERPHNILVSSSWDGTIKVWK